MAQIDLDNALVEAENKALDALARYKFMMFGYHAAVWVKLNRLGGGQLPNPFKELVQTARKIEERNAAQTETKKTDRPAKRGAWKGGFGSDAP